MDTSHPGKSGALAINKASKISKSIKKPSASAPRPVAKVYKADPSDFRRVVQELTGTNAASPSAQAPPPQKVTRLQRIAPPPLRPSFHPLPPAHPQNASGLPMLSPHLLAPLPVLTPGDNAWANPFDYLLPEQKRRSATDAGGDPGRPIDLMPVPSPRFPWTPTGMWSPCFHPPPPLPSPGLPSPLPLSPLPSPLHLSPSFLPPLSPSFFPPSFFPPLPSPSIHNTFAMNAAAPPQSSQDFTFQGWGGNRIS